MPQPARNSLETILVAEDHPVVLEAVRTILERAGYQVLTAANGVNAIKLERGYCETIHLLLSDVMMPDLSGPALAKILKIYRPDMRVMLMSGYAGGDLLVLNHGWHFIEKPFLPAQLIEKISAVLHTPERSQGDDHFDTRLEPKVGTTGA